MRLPLFFFNLTKMYSQKAECVLRRPPIHSWKQLRVYTASDANWLTYIHMVLLQTEPNIKAVNYFHLQQLHLLTPSYPLPLPESDVSKWDAEVASGMAMDAEVMEYTCMPASVTSGMMLVPYDQPMYGPHLPGLEAGNGEGSKALEYVTSLKINSSKKFGNSSLTDDFSLVTNSFSLHLVSLESPVIPLYNDVPFVMITQFGDVQHTWIWGWV